MNKSSSKVSRAKVLKVPDSVAGERADVFLARNYPRFTRSALERLFDEGFIAINGVRIKAGHKLKGCEKLSVNESLLHVSPARINLEILYEDSDVIVINKPEGVLTHVKGTLNNESTVASFLKPKINDPSLVSNRAGIAHRLDRATSGLIITAKNSQALGKLQNQFSTKKVKKTYLAIVEGVPEESEAIIEAPIERNPKRPQNFRVGSLGKPSTTIYKFQKLIKMQGKTYSLLELRPLTGRTHQLRVHLKFIGHPVVGDRIYGKAGEHLYLHAWQLEITLPNSQRKNFKVPPPKYFKEFIRDGR